MVFATDCVNAIDFISVLTDVSGKHYDKENNSILSIYLHGTISRRHECIMAQTYVTDV